MKRLCQFHLPSTSEVRHLNGFAPIFMIFLMAMAAMCSRPHVLFPRLLHQRVIMRPDDALCPAERIGLTLVLLHTLLPHVDSMHLCRFLLHLTLFLIVSHHYQLVLPAPLADVVCAKLMQSNDQGRPCAAAARAAVGHISTAIILSTLIPFAAFAATGLYPERTFVFCAVGLQLNAAWAALLANLDDVAESMNAALDDKYRLYVQPHLLVV
ncbi:Aste57867_8871 [Aphanomyces stellatus]|uniref:Aste57867_8871 protein n=1 Tax=Aphanomyces stellatus TaxID=120398 RepID=A0A485KLD8_9STRA|nr:hypothetical protein As57867_008836 [Aphanomyces stellatus]VFT85757.1 Aste57867_8871 [Aphanomyces stellatus]